MRRLIAAAAAACALTCSASAGAYSDDMSKCLVKSTTTDDEAVFVQWMFAALSLHPKVKGMANVTDEQRDALNKQAAALFVRLMTKDCRAETLAALKVEGTSAAEQAFMVFGQAAGRSLFKDPAVQKGTESLASAFDTKDINDLLKEAGVSK